MTLQIEQLTDTELSERFEAFGKLYAAALNRVGGKTEDSFMNFLLAIMSMNNTYNLPVALTPTVSIPTEKASVRISNFLKTIQNEVDEGKEIIKQLEEVENTQTVVYGKLTDEQVEALVHITDWFADMIVYISSEATKFGVPLIPALEIIMASNFSKLDENGQPIKDENGKFLKGPNYTKPEPILRSMIVDVFKKTSVSI